MNRPERVLLGVVTSAHGVRGEVVVKSFTAEEESLADYGPLTDKEGREPLTLSLRGAVAKGLIARIDGVEDRNAAELLKGRELWIERELLPEEEDGEFYYVDLIGLTAVDIAGRPFGTVKDVANFGGGDLLEIAVTETGKNEFVPFKDVYVPEVDLPGGRVVVRWPLQFEIVNPDPAESEDGSAGD